MKQKLQLEKGTVDGKIRQLEGDLLIMEDQNSKVQKVCRMFGSLCFYDFIMKKYSKCYD